MAKAMVIFRVNDFNCLEKESNSNVFKKMEKYGLTLLFSKNSALLSPNMCNLLMHNGVSYKNAPLLLYAVWVRHLIGKGCLSVLKVVSDCPLRVVIDSFVNFLNNGVRSDGFLWYSINGVYYYAPEIHILDSIYVNNQNTSLESFVEDVFSSRINSVHKLVKHGDKKYVLKTQWGVELPLLGGKPNSYHDAHVFSLIKVKAEKVGSGSKTPVDYLPDYPVCHPFNKLIHNVNRIIFGYDNVRGCDVNMLRRDEYSLRGKLGKTKTISLSDGVGLGDLKNCVLMGVCDWVEINDKKIGNYLKLLVLNHYIKEYLLFKKFGIGKESKKFLGQYDSSVVRTLFYPSVNDVLIGAFSHFLSMVKPFNDNKYSVFMHYRLIDDYVPFFVGLSIIGDSGYTVGYQVFYYSPFVVVGKNLTYYYNNKYTKKSDVYSPDDIVLSDNVTDTSRSIYTTYI